MILLTVSKIGGALMSEQRRLIGNRIKSRRKQLGISLGELEKRTGITNSALSKIERGLVAVSAENLYAISQALDVSIEWLLTGVDRGFVIQEKPFGYRPVANPELVEAIVDDIQKLPVEDLQLLKTLVRKLLKANEAET
nr:hypothetical protein [Bacillota bacterium]